MKVSIKATGTFRAQVEIVHPVLRRMMGLKADSTLDGRAFHDVQISLSNDPIR